MGHWGGIKTIKWSEKVTNEEVLERIGDKMTLLNNILRIKTNCIANLLRRNCLFYDFIEG